MVKICDTMFYHIFFWFIKSSNFCHVFWAVLADGLSTGNHFLGKINRTNELQFL